MALDRSARPYTGPCILAVVKLRLLDLQLPSERICGQFASNQLDKELL